MQFYIDGIQTLFLLVQPTAATTWNVGRGKTSEFNAMDVMLMILAVLKHGGSWDTLDTILTIKFPTLMRLANGFMRKIYTFCVYRFVKQNKERFFTEHSDDKENYSRISSMRYKPLMPPSNNPINPPGISLMESCIT